MIQKKLRNNYFIIILSCSLISSCETSQQNNDTVTFKNISSYFKEKGWDFPIAILDSALVVKYYRDSLILNSVPPRHNSGIEKIKALFQDKEYEKIFLKLNLLDTSAKNIYGYTVSHPTIFIDTSDYGDSKNEKVFLGFSVSKFKINIDSANNALPCENCFLEENRKILRYPNGIFFELNKAKDSLIFSRWD